MKITPTQIKRHKWWWRLPQKGFTISDSGKTKGAKNAPGQWWKDGVEVAAFKYELFRRLDRANNPKTWLEVCGNAAVFLSKRIGQSVIPWPTWTGTDPKRLEKQNPTLTEPALFNLECSDSMLMNAFQDFISEQRRVKGVRKPKILPKNTVSWKWLEVWDANEIDRVPLNNSEHSMKAKAQKKAKEVQNSVLIALNEAMEFEKSLPDASKDIARS